MITVYLLQYLILRLTKKSKKLRCKILLFAHAVQIELNLFFFNNIKIHITT